MHIKIIVIDCVALSGNDESRKCIPAATKDNPSCMTKNRKLGK
jgi:hypothetical protein